MDKARPTLIRSNPKVIHNLSTTIVKFTCPTCEQPIETGEEDARAGVVCPGCGTRFVPAIERKPTLGMKMAQPDYTQFREVERIETHARSLSSSSFVFFAIAALILLGAGCTAWEYESANSMNRKDFSWTACSVAAGFLLLGLWLQLLSQLMRIRALLERKK